MTDLLEFPVPGLPIEETDFVHQKTSILIRIRELCGWKRDTFPGSQPVSLSSSNIGELGKSPYVACEKTDGVRYLLFAASQMAFLVDRKETVRVLHMTLPIPQEALNTGDASGRELQTHQVTLLDGELVQDTLANDEKRVSFLIYDLICIQRDTTIAKKNLLERLKVALTDFVRPRAMLEDRFPLAVQMEKQQGHYMPIYLKDFFEIWDIMAIRNYSSRRLPHLSDGIIFTPVLLPYVPGTCRGLLKWKPPELNTIDFASELLYSHDIDGNRVPVAAKLIIGSRGFRVDSGYWIAVNEGFWHKMVEKEMTTSDCDGSIWECYFDPKVTTIIPEACTGPRDTYTRIVARWDQFWAQQSEKVGEKRKPQLDLDEGRYKKIQKRVVQAVNRLHDDHPPEQFYSTEEAPGIGRLPIFDNPGYKCNVCPIAAVKGNTKYFDFTHAQVVEGGWVLERIRTDKTTPNDERVMQRVKESIESGIDQIQLFHTLLSFRDSGLKPVHAHCHMPEYYGTHGSRVQSESNETYRKQMEETNNAVKAALYRITQQQHQQQQVYNPQQQPAIYNAFVEQPSIEASLLEGLIDDMPQLMIAQNQPAAQPITSTMPDLPISSSSDEGEGRDSDSDSSSGDEN